MRRTATTETATVSGPQLYRLRFEGIEQRIVHGAPLRYEETDCCTHSYLKLVPLPIASRPILKPMLSLEVLSKGHPGHAGDFPPRSPFTLRRRHRRRPPGVRPGGPLASVDANHWEQRSDARNKNNIMTHPITTPKKRSAVIRSGE